MNVFESAAVKKSIIPIANAIELIAGIASNLTGGSTARYIGENQLTNSLLRDMAASEVRQFVLTKKVG